MRFKTFLLEQKSLLNLFSGLEILTDQKRNYGSIDMYQYLLLLEHGKQQVINASNPINFPYANMVIQEMGYSEKVKRITFLGKLEGY